MTAERPHACETCPANPSAALLRHGDAVDGATFVVALAGNPNVGKSTVFNHLTGLRQHTGNWPGKTVVRAEGSFTYHANRYKVVDLPGTYSLLSTSSDEEVARDFILFGRPDVTVIVADATRLERNLNLVLQVLEITDRAVLCVNLIDEAEQHGITVDARSLSRDLGIPVITAAARTGAGMPELLQALHEVATGAFICSPRRFPISSSKLRSVEALSAKVEQAFPGLPNARWVALRLLEGDARIVDAVRTGELGRLTHERRQRTEGKEHETAA